MTVHPWENETGVSFIWQIFIKALQAVKKKKGTRRGPSRMETDK